MQEMADASQTSGTSLGRGALAEAIFFGGTAFLTKRVISTCLLVLWANAQAREPSAMFSLVAGGSLFLYWCVLSRNLFRVG